MSLIHCAGMLTDCEPCIQIPRVHERDFAVGADGGVDGERMEGIHGGVVLLSPV